MATDSSLGTLGVNIAAYAGQFMAELTRAENGMTKFQNGISKTLTKAGLDTIGLGNAARAMSNELQYVWANIEKIPGIDPATIASVQEMKTEVGEFQNSIHQLVANGIGMFAHFGKSLGLVAGAIVSAFQKTNLKDLLTNPSLVAANFAVALGDIDLALKQEMVTASAAAKEQNKLTAAVNLAAKAQKENAALISGNARANADFARSEEARKKTLASLGEAIRKEVITPQEEWADQLSTLNDLLKEGAISQETFKRAMKNADLKLEAETTVETKIVKRPDKDPANLDRVRSAAEEFQSEMSMMWASVSDRAGEAFADMVLDGENAFKKLPELAARAAINIAARMAIINPLMNMLFGAFSGFTALPSFFGPGSAPAGARAAGGPVAGGSTYLVGEKGPELFTPSASGSIIPNHALSSGDRSGPVNHYYIDARGTDESVVQRMQAALQALAGPGVVERRAVAAMADNRRRGVF